MIYKRDTFGLFEAMVIEEFVNKKLSMLKIAPDPNSNKTLRDQMVGVEEVSLLLRFVVDGANVETYLLEKVICDDDPNMFKYRIEVLGRDDSSVGMVYYSKKFQLPHRYMRMDDAERRIETLSKALGEILDNAQKRGTAIMAQVKL